MTATPARWRSVARVTFALVCAAWWLQKLGWAQPVGQWDFRVYYFGAQAWRAGLNPYDPAVLPPDLAGQGLRFSYPPYALALFAPFAVLSVVRATQLFIVLKVAKVHPSNASKKARKRFLITLRSWQKNRYHSKLILIVCDSTCDRDTYLLVMPRCNSARTEKDGARPAGVKNPFDFLLKWLTRN